MDIICLKHFIQKKKSVATINCLVTNILQNIFCVQQKKETRTGSESVKKMTAFSFLGEKS